MRLVQFLVRLVIKTIGVALVLLLVLVAGMWIRGRFFSNDEVDLTWAHHAHAGHNEASKHGTHLSLGSAAFIGDKESALNEPGTAAPSSQPSTQPAVATSSLPCGVEMISHQWTANPGYIVVAGPGNAPRFSMMGFEYGSEEANGETYRWAVTPYWLLTL